MPDAAGLQTLAGDLGGAVTEAVHDRGQAALHVDAAQARTVLQALRDRGYTFLCSVHGLDYYPDEPRFGVQYELLDMDALDRVAVKLRVPLDAPEVDSVCDLWPGANHQEREVYDMFGVIFRGHPDLRRILMPEDYEGHPQRRDFPIGGEPILFTHNERTVPRWFE